MATRRDLRLIEQTGIYSGPAKFNQLILNDRLLRTPEFHSGLASPGPVEDRLYRDHDDFLWNRRQPQWARAASAFAARDALARSRRRTVPPGWGVLSARGI